ncbi:hypothetical protein [Allopontixanthobacter sediminis]|uniref:Lipocalin-like domain-containing protein n=1 Tax=Allopontixanthobacter sediminis TaxID=1689985 RepID=A0A845B6C7_9SPHN|nr:hypothetical protein [Allopontixanthobacter sediminis]MXP45704.1 hypothetical protein [Allopontixanthobacter sediminis]
MISRAIFPSALLLAACGQGGAEGGEQASPVSLAEGDTAAALTPAYLQGGWCYSHNVMGDERSDEMMSYIFSDDGTLLYQVNPETEIEKPGTYTIEEGHLKIIPTLRFFDFTIESIDPDAMVLKMAYGLAYWERGTCAA